MPTPAENVESRHADFDVAAAELRKAKEAYAKNPTEGKKRSKEQAAAAVAAARQELRDAIAAGGPAFVNYPARARQ